MEDMTWVGDKLRSLAAYLVKNITKDRTFAESAIGQSPEYLDRFYSVLKQKLSEDDNIDDFDIDYALEFVL